MSILLEKLLLSCHCQHVIAVYLAQGCWVCFFLFMHPFEGFLDVPAKETLRTAFFFSSSISRLEISLRVILLPVNVLRCPSSFLWQAISNFRELHTMQTKVCVPSPKQVIPDEGNSFGF